MTEEPWPIANALAAIKEVRDREGNYRHDSEDRYADGVARALDYATEVIKSINKLKPPQEPTAEEVARKAVRDFTSSFGQLIEDFGRALQDFEPKWDDE